MNPASLGMNPFMGGYGSSPLTPYASPYSGYGTNPLLSGLGLNAGLGIGGLNGLTGFNGINPLLSGLNGINGLNNFGYPQGLGLNAGLGLGGFPGSFYGNPLTTMNPYNRFPGIAY
uniref:Uncharacterized protein n=1 Tax=Panagrolaimus superbus TaxID=310955 RepID=A0A914YCJ7_9BILA